MSLCEKQSCRVCSYSAILREKQWCTFLFEWWRNLRCLCVSIHSLCGNICLWRYPYNEWHIHQIHKNGGHARARHFRTDNICSWISSVQTRTRNIVLAKRNRRHGITANHAIHAITMLFSILKYLDSMLPITHPRLLPCVCHIYEFGVCSGGEY